MPSNISELQKRVSEAKDSLNRAEAELETLLKTVETNERADKKMISEILKHAFEDLATAKEKLASILVDPPER